MLSCFLLTKLNCGPPQGGGGGSLGGAPCGVMGKLHFIKPYEFFYHLLIKYSAKQLWKHLRKQGWKQAEPVWGDAVAP